MEAASNHISDKRWSFYDEHGYVKLGKVADGFLAALQQRIDDIMLGRAEVDYDQMLMQEDADSDDYSQKPQSKGHKGAHLNYRKIEQLEFDPLFLQYMQLSIFREACGRLYGQETRIAAFRAMFMNKPAGKGSYLVWHQDAWNILDRQPLLTVWTALDPATVASGCMQIIPGSHKLGRINTKHGSGFLTDEQAEQHCCHNILDLELQAGEVALLHNWILHSSARNGTNTPRRAFSVCYMDAATKCRDGTDGLYSIIFGDGALSANELRRD